jgi:hypothetical protein
VVFGRGWDIGWGALGGVGDEKLLRNDYVFLPLIIMECEVHSYTYTYTCSQQKASEIKLLHIHRPRLHPDQSLDSIFDYFVHFAP